MPGEPVRKAADKSLVARNVRDKSKLRGALFRRAAAQAERDIACSGLRGKERFSNRIILKLWH